MVLIILLVLLLLMVQAFLPAKYLTDQVGPEKQMGPRDDLPQPSPELHRAQNALRNLQETLPIFLTLAVLGIVLDAVTIISLAGAVLYLLARVAHLVCYLRALSPWRSVAFGISLLGLIAMVIPLLWHLW
ncbi:membrane protein [Devosia pacifica]|uniref:Membrane protein n=1 Tax=Devosia pacifica TaxID=1335967 RepID=A0A918RUX5_9HYPH|nr:MAPEG family protein [Devosia pacifica]GHA13073.1 membrane protein [Devosia pacifica]